MAESPFTPEAQAQLIAAIQAALGGGTPARIIAGNTRPLRVAIGHLEPTPSVMEAELAGRRFAVTRDIEFQVKVRIGFVFRPAAGLSLPSVSILTGWLTRGLVDFLIGREEKRGRSWTQLVFSLN